MVSVNSKGGDARLIRALNKSYAGMQKSIERLASGKRVVGAGDDPAAVVLSERLSSDLKGVDQSIRNIEVDISILQTVDSVLETNTSLLSYLKQITLRALNATNNEDIVREIAQEEIDVILDTLGRLNREARFGDKKLLDGSFGASGFTTVPELTVISLNEKTQPTSSEGIEVEVTKRGTQSFILAPNSLEQTDLQDSITFRASSGGQLAEYTTKPNDTPDSVRSNFQDAVTSAGLDITVDFSPNQHLLLYHNQYGSKYTFKAGSSEGGLLSNQSGGLDDALIGDNAEGSVDGETLIGDGQFLKTSPGSKYEGLTLRYSFDTSNLSSSSPNFDKGTTGKLNISQNSPYFQVSPVYGGGFKFSFDDLSLDHLGRTAINKSNFKNLKNINVLSAKDAGSSLKVVEAAQNQIYSFRSRVGAAQKHGLESNLSYMQNIKGNLSSAISTVRDVDYAAETINLIRSQLNINAASWAFKKSNQAQDSIIRLLRIDDTNIS